MEDAGSGTHRGIEVRTPNNCASLQPIGDCLKQSTRRQANRSGLKWYSLSRPLLTSIMLSYTRILRLVTVFSTFDLMVAQDLSVPSSWRVSTISITAVRGPSRLLSVLFSRNPAQLAHSQNGSLSLKARSVGYYLSSILRRVNSMVC